MRFYLRWIVCLLLSLPLRAEGLLSKVQHELRARKFYFGEINGRATDEVVSAIESFQKAHGIDRTGNLDEETLRTLGLPADHMSNRDAAQLLDECCTCVREYLQAWQSGDWQREAAFFTDIVNYYEDQNVSLDFIRAIRMRELHRWPHRKSTMLNRIASLEPGHTDQAQVTARIRTEVAGESGPSKGRTEDLIFRLQKTEQGWCIAALKLLE